MRRPRRAGVEYFANKTRAQIPLVTFLPTKRKVPQNIFTHVTRTLTSSHRKGPTPGIPGCAPEHAVVELLSLLTKKTVTDTWIFFWLFPETQLAK